MLERLARHSFFCYLDGYSGSFQIPIDRSDKDKTTFTCPYGIFAYPRMPFDLYNALLPSNIACLPFFEYVKRIMEVFMNDFLVYKATFNICLENWAKVLCWCKEVGLFLNWENYYSMVQGVVLRWVVFNIGIKMDIGKVEVINQLSPPTNIKRVRSFIIMWGSTVLYRLLQNHKASYLTLRERYHFCIY